MTESYRWNVADHAAGYDAAAHVIHPHYLEIQDAILAEIARPADASFLLVDLGGGSGRLAEKFLTRFPQAAAVVIDQSEAFLKLAATRLARFGSRAMCHVARLQDDWTAALPQAPEVIVSMSAIHHLDAAEKQAIYRRAYDVLKPLGILLNGDEVRADEELEYRRTLETWAAHMQKIVAEGQVAPVMQPVLEAWQDRNVTRFDQPRVSGDDCHQTIAEQLNMLVQCHFRSVGVPWMRDLWAVLEGVK